MSWGKPVHASKWHFFRPNGRSLCYSQWFAGLKYATKADILRKDVCATCHREVERIEFNDQASRPRRIRRTPTKGEKLLGWLETGRMTGVMGRQSPSRQKI